MRETVKDISQQLITRRVLSPRGRWLSLVFHFGQIDEFVVPGPRVNSFPTQQENQSATDSRKGRSEAIENSRLKRVASGVTECKRKPFERRAITAVFEIETRI